MDNLCRLYYALQRIQSVNHHHWKTASVNTERVSNNPCRDIWLKLHRLCLSGFCKSVFVWCKAELSQYHVFETVIGSIQNANQLNSSVSVLLQRSNSLSVLLFPCMHKDNSFFQISTTHIAIILVVAEYYSKRSIYWSHPRTQNVITKSNLSSAYVAALCPWLIHPFILPPWSRTQCEKTCIHVNYHRSS